ncbi:PRC-barrel domain-containing protein [Streptomyces sp. NPDC002935]|uniref:PRC-barrel domain-containing protein n=1 Tax=unclassified Streptomyces TaxID=2593676 RepID=UPI00332660AE
MHYHHRPHEGLRHPLMPKKADVNSAYLVVDTGVWIFGKHVLLPAGTVARVDQEEQKIYVDLTKEQIKDSPEFDKDKHTGDAGYHEQISGYYQSHRSM